MKRTILALVLTPLLAGSVLAAGYTGPGSDQYISTVAGALKASDDAPVVLEGRIIKRLNNERYEFQDATGTIQVEIDDDEWPGQAISEATEVRLFGEVDRHLTSREIDVERIEIIQ